MPPQVQDDIDAFMQKRTATAPKLPSAPKPAPVVDDDVDGFMSRRTGSVSAPTTKKEQLRRSVTGLQSELTAATPQLKPGNTLNVTTGRQYPTPPPPPFQSPVDMRLNAPNEAQKAFDRAAAAMPAPQAPTPRPKQTLGQMRQQAGRFTPPEPSLQPVTPEQRKQKSEQFISALAEDKVRQQAAAKAKLEEEASRASQSTLGRMGTRFARGAVRGVTQTPFEFVQMANPDPVVRQTMGRIADDSKEWQSQNLPVDNRNPATLNVFKPEFYSLENVGKAATENIPESLGEMLPQMALARGAGGVARLAAPELAAAAVPRMASTTGAQLAARTAAGGYGAAQLSTQAYQKALDAGMTPEQAARAAAIEAPIGFSEFLGSPGTTGFTRPGTTIRREMREEGLQELGQTAASGLAGKYASGYDANKPLLDIAGESIGGGLLGAATGGIVAAPGARLQARQQANQRRAIRSAIDQRSAANAAAIAPQPAAVLPVADPSAGPVAAQPQPAAPAVTQAQPQGFPRLPEPEGFNARRAKLLGMPTPAEVGINEQVQAAARLLDSTNEGDQRQGRRMLNKALTDLRKAEGYLAEAALPPDAERPFTAVRDAIEARLKPAPKAPKGLNPEVQKSVDLAKQDAVEAEQAGNYEAAANHWKAAHSSLVAAQREIRRSGNAEQIKAIATDISIADANRRKANQAARTAQRQAGNKPVKTPASPQLQANPNAPQAQQSVSDEQWYQSLPQKQREILDLHWQGVKPAAIQRQVKAGIGEIASVIDAFNQRGQANAPTAGLPENPQSAIRNPQSTEAPLLRPDAVQNPEGGIPQMPEPSFTDRLEAAARRDASARGKAKPAKRLLSRIAELGGISDRYAGELQDVKDARRIGVIRDRATMSPDVLARQLQSEGYDVDPEDLNTLWEAARRDVAGRDERTSQTSELERRLAEEEAAYNERQPFDQIVADVDAEPTNRLREAEYEGGEVQRYSKPLEGQAVEREAFQPDTADLREVREFAKREPQAEQFTEEPPTAPLARRRQPIRPPAPTSPRPVGNRPLSVDVAGTRTPVAMSPDFPRARREMVKQGREVDALLKAKQDKGEFGNVAEAMFKSNTPDVLHGQDSFFHDPDVKGKLGLTREAEMADVRRELKTQLARSLGLTADEVSLSHIKPEVWRAWAKQKGLGREAVRKLEAGIARAERKQRATETNAQIVAEESQRAQSEVRQPAAEAESDRLGRWFGEIAAGIPRGDKLRQIAMGEMLKGRLSFDAESQQWRLGARSGKKLAELIRTENVTKTPQEQFDQLKADADKVLRQFPNHKRSEQLQEKLDTLQDLANRVAKAQSSFEQRQQSAPPVKSIDAQIKDIRDLQKFDLIDDKEAKRKIAALEAQRPKIAERREAQPRTREDVENSPEFKRWFGDSKVVDESGKPLVVYHGTQSPNPITSVDFSKLDPDALFGPGFYTTQDPAIAAGEGGYALTKRPNQKSSDAPAPHAYPLYLSIQKPFKIDGWHNPEKFLPALGDTSFKKFEVMSGADIYQRLTKLTGSKKKANEYLKSLGFDGITHPGGNRRARFGTRSFADEGAAKQYAGRIGGEVETSPYTGNVSDALIEEIGALWRLLPDDVRGDFWQSLKEQAKTNPDVQPAISMLRDIQSGSVKGVSVPGVIELGLQFLENPQTENLLAGDFAEQLALLNDGLEGRVSSIHTVLGHRVWIAFYPEQVKSAIGNRGTFDPNSAKITERRSEAMPERYTGRQLFENAQLTFRPARNRPATLVANDWGGAMLNRLLSEKFDVTTTDANFTIGAKDAKDLRDYLADAKDSGIYEPAQVANMDAMLKQMDAAIADAEANQQDVAFVTRRPAEPISATKAKIRHEAAHLSQSRIAADLSALTGKNWLDSQPNAKNIHKELDRRGYAPETHDYEAAAFVASGDYGVFGMNLDQAAKFLSDYFGAVVEKHGKRALQKFGAIDPKLQPTLEAARRETETGQTENQRRSVEAAQRSERRIGAAGEARGSSAGVLARRREGDTGDVREASRSPRTRASVENSPEFKRWFGDSVATENGKPGGKPVVVYHSTWRNFDAFDTESAKKVTGADDSSFGFHFGTATQADKRLFRHESPTLSRDAIIRNMRRFDSESAAKVLPVYLQLKNPIRMEDAGAWEGKSLIKALNEAGVYGDFAERSPREIAKMLQRQGYDGIIYQNFGEMDLDEQGNFRDSYIVFNPSQIKSATGNRGTFDPSSPRISEQKSRPARRGVVLASGLGAFQNLFERDAKPKEAKPAPLPKDFDLAKWSQKSYADAIANTLPAEARAEYDKAETQKEKFAVLMSAPVDAAVEAKVFELIDKATLAAEKDDGRAVAEAVRDMREYSLSPATNWEKAGALRKAFMLSRPVTHLRNIIGNTAFQPIEEAARIPGSLADSAIGLMTGRRTLKGANPLEMAKATYIAATDGWQRAKDAMKGLDLDKLEDALQVREVKFKNKLVDKTVKAIFRSLSAEDQIFFTYAYDRALREQAKLTALNERKAGVIDGAKATRDRTDYLYKNPTDQMGVDAMTAAEVAVFRNNNKLSDALRSARESLGDKGTFTLDLFLPFDRTPTNLVLRTLEYTPAGGLLAAGKGAMAAGRGVKSFAKSRKELPTRQAIKKAIDDALTPQQQRDLAQLLGRSTTGTGGLITLGYQLAAAGLMTGFYDEEDRDANKRQMELGARPSSIKIGGRWYQVGGIPPLGTLLALGATLHKDLKDQRDPEEIIGSAVAGMGKVALGLPQLEAIKGLSEAVTKEGRAGQKVGRIVASFVPGLLSDSGQVVPGLRDPYERETRGDKKLKPLTRFARDVGGEVAARIPGVRRMLPEKKTPLGRPIPTEWSDVIDPFNSRPAETSADIGGMKGERLRFGTLGSEIRQKVGEPEAVYKQRVQRVEGWMSEYGDKLLSHPRYGTLTAAQQEAAIESLRRRIGTQQNAARPRLDSFAPEKIIQSVLKSEATRPKREAGKLWSPSARQ